MSGTGLPQTEITYKKTDQPISLFVYPLFYIQSIDLVDTLNLEN